MRHISATIPEEHIEILNKMVKHNLYLSRSAIFRDVISICEEIVDSENIIIQKLNDAL